MSPSNVLDLQKIYKRSQRLINLQFRKIVPSIDLVRGDMLNNSRSMHGLFLDNSQSDLECQSGWVILPDIELNKYIGLNEI